MDGPIWREYKATGLTRMMWSLLFPSVEQVTRKFSGLPIRAVNLSVGRLVADTHGLTLELQSPRDLFG